ncbi:Sec-independent protein translocase protein TatB [Accumulibacter sp.]|uniref:Sec-independent protein translocase protein TatB n=1 Tax=Accumulibacter sp. TaxID=2053492 RepID=UPI0025D5128B|nr:Sec-independent protein translocase protein TatB [Accumulibacter sp.]MCM8596272.1 Sec-independent protein translocase protein TatB [Accumulibacter sp.]MCM8627203.1 Sec-independent protein translocase protein TatB [Accumulibacter sp.]MDS4050421.1 Sec-independent protein translocase protein TatB [Accumulibacter sp.]
MFDIGFSEMIVIAIVALVVIGPERLPRVARTAGHLLGRLQRYVSDVKADINREMQIEELRRLQNEIEQSARNVEQSLSTEIQAAREAVQQTAQAVTGNRTAVEASQPAPESSPAIGSTPPASPANEASDRANPPATPGPTL